MEKREKITCKENPGSPYVHFPAEILQVRKEWKDISKMFEDKNCQPRILYIGKVSFR